MESRRQLKRELEILRADFLGSIIMGNRTNRLIREYLENPQKHSDMEMQVLTEAVSEGSVFAESAQSMLQLLEILENPQLPTEEGMKIVDEVRAMFESMRDTLGRTNRRVEKMIDDAKRNGQAG